MDIRSYEDALRVLQDLGPATQRRCMQGGECTMFNAKSCRCRLKSVRLYTNNPDKMTALKSITQEALHTYFGLQVERCLPLLTGSSTCICAICAQCSLPQDEEGEAR